MARLWVFFAVIYLSLPAYAAPGSETYEAYGGDAQEATSPHAEKTSGLPQLDLTWFPSQIFWLGIAFTVLYIVVSNKIVPSITSNLQNREQTIQGDLATAEKLTQDASAFQKSYEESLQTARAEANAMMSDLDDKMRKEHEKKQAAFQKKTEEKITETKKQLTKMTDSSMKDIESHIEETALIAAKNIAGIDTDGKAVKAALKAVNSNIKAEAA